MKIGGGAHAGVFVGFMYYICAELAAICGKDRRPVLASARKLQGRIVGGAQGTYHPLTRRASVGDVLRKTTRTSPTSGVCFYLCRAWAVICNLREF